MADKRKALTPAQREALDTPAAKRSAKQFELAAQADEAVKVTDNESPAKSPIRSRRKRRSKLAKDIRQHQLLVSYISATAAS